MSVILVMQNKTWLEVALNGPWGKKAQPGIPISVADIVAQGIECARDGARGTLASAAEVRRALNKH